MRYPAGVLPNIRLAQAMCHHYQFRPFGIPGYCGIIQIHFRELDAALFKLQVVEDQAAEFHMQYLHTGEGTVDKDEGITLLNVLMHLV